MVCFFISQFSFVLANHDGCENPIPTLGKRPLPLNIFDERVSSKLQKLGFEPLHISALQESMYIPKNQEDDLKKLSQLYNTPKIIKFRNAFFAHSPIKVSPLKTVLTPPLRFYGSLTRNEIIELVNNGIATHYRCQLSVIPQSKEDKENHRLQKKAEKNRKKMQAKFNACSSAINTLSPIEREAGFWVNFVNFFRDEKERISMGNSPLISTSLIISKFLSCVSTNYEGMITFGQYTVYYTESTLRLNHKPDPNLDETNADIMMKGMSPIGPDGAPMNLHHISHSDPGFLVLISEETHQKHSGDLHFPKSVTKSKKRMGRLGRKEFEKTRKKIFPAIAEHIIAKKNGAE